MSRMPSQNQQGPQIEGHIPGLDGVRGLAILLVMVLHFTLQFYPINGFETGLRAAFLRGWWGVDLFFVLSGFLITGILLDAKGSSHYFRNFYVRRVLRIFPLYYGFLFAFFFLAPLVRPPTPGGQFESWQSSQWWYWTYLSNYQLLFPESVRPPALIPFWSLAVEEQFYLFWPTVVILTSRKGLIRACLVCVVGSLLVRLWLSAAGFPPWGLIHRATPARLDTLAIGAALAVFVRDANAWTRIRRNVRVAIVASVGALVALSLSTHGATQAMIQMEKFGFPFIAVVSAALIVVAIDPARQTTRLARFFRTRVMRLFGKYSYAMYVFHYPLVVVLAAKGVAIDGFPRVAGSQLPAALAFTAIGIAISFLLAFLSWHLYEKHFLKLKRYFPREGADRAEKSAFARGTDASLPFVSVLQPGDGHRASAEGTENHGSMR